MKKTYKGVVFQSRKNTFIENGVSIGEGTLIGSGVCLTGKTKIGRNCEIGTNSVLNNVFVGDNVKIASSQIEDSIIEDNSTIGPFSHIRPDSVIKKGVRIGNFVEIKSSIIGPKTKIAHLTYVGNAVIGENVNIGCGVVFANYDGKSKHQTIVGDNVFIGSNCNLIAPVNIDDEVFIACATTVTSDLKRGDFAIGRVRQEVKPNYHNKYIQGIKEDAIEEQERGNRFFGTDGIRGVYGKEVTEHIAYICAKAICRLFKNPKITLATDTRKSGASIKSAFIKGLDTNEEVFDIGIATTPCVAFMTNNTGSDFGVVFTASHNPSSHNGIKIFANDGKKLSLETERKIDKIMRLIIDCQFDEKTTSIISVKKFSISPYIDYVSSQISDLSGKKIVLDLANGSAIYTAKTIFEKSGAKIIYLGDDSDGEINSSCGCLFIENLSKSVKENNADFGFAFDGDADRVLAVDEKGQIIDGDQMMYCLAKELKRKSRLREDTVVMTLQSNLGLVSALEKEGINSAIVPVGDKYVMSEMEENGYSLGGEQSGHIITKDVAGSGDGVLVGVLLANISKTKNKPLSLLCNFRRYPQIQKSFDVLDKNIVNNENILLQITVLERFLEERGRIVLRPSGTENKIRLLVEAEKEKDCKAVFEKMCLVIENEINSTDEIP